MYPILTRLGPFFVYSYTAVFAIGILLCWVITHHQSAAKSLADWPNAAVATLLLGWVGARISFILLNWGYFAERPFELFHLWQGGLTAYGGLLGGVLGLGVWCWYWKRPYISYATLFSPAFLLLISTGWAACWVEGCAYGTQAILGPLTANLPDSYGIFTVRYHTQLLGIGLNLAAFTFILWGQKRWQNGRLFSLTLLFASLIQFSLTFLRGDEVGLFAGWRLDSWLTLLLAILAVLLLQYGRSQKKLNGNSQEKPLNDA